MLGLYNTCAKQKVFFFGDVHDVSCMHFRVALLFLLLAGALGGCCVFSFCSKESMNRRIGKKTISTLKDWRADGTFLLG